jgi:hypothetical protein
MSHTIKISARKVQEVLAGKITAAQLFGDYDHSNSKCENPFLQALQRGLTMEHVKFTRLPELDDDILEIAFGLPDPAIRRFTIEPK